MKKLISTYLNPFQRNWTSGHLEWLRSIWPENVGPTCLLALGGSGSAFIPEEVLFQRQSVTGVHVSD